MGTILAIPASVLVDWAVQGFLPSPLAFFGIALIIIGFVAFTFSEFVGVWRAGRLGRGRGQLVGSGETPSSFDREGDEEKPLLHTPSPSQRRHSPTTLFWRYLI